MGVMNSLTPDLEKVFENSQMQEHISFYTGTPRNRRTTRPSVRPPITIHLKMISSRILRTDLIKLGIFVKNFMSLVPDFTVYLGTEYLSNSLP